MKEKSVFEFRDYKAYLLSRTGPSGTRTGKRSGIASAAKCNTAYVSQVLNGSSHFSLEQAEKIGREFGHTEEETHFFLLLVQMCRAGSRDLRAYFENQIDQILEQRLNIQKRLGMRKTLLPADQSAYYSSWYCAAIHVALSVPDLRRAEQLSKYFDLPIAKVRKTLAFLVSVGLAKEKSGLFEIGETYIHLGKDSENILKHHTNWRLKALENLIKEDDIDVHYASAITISKKDAFRLKDSIIDSIRQMNKQVVESKEEEVYCFTTDFFRLGK